MALFSGRSTTAPFDPKLAGPTASSEGLSQRLSALLARIQDSSHLFASPLCSTEPLAFEIPHFVYFGPHAADDSPRIAFLAGFAAEDLRGTFSLLRFVDHLSEFPDLGDGLSLSFFPLVDAWGALQNLKNRGLGRQAWHGKIAPELGLLEREIRARPYHGFVRIESAAPGAEEILVSTRKVGGISRVNSSPPIICPDDTELLPARFEPESSAEVFSDGPLSVECNAPYAPFEVTLAFPLSWTEGAHRVAVHTILRRLIRRYRNLQAYGQNL